MRILPVLLAILLLPVLPGAVAPARAQCALGEELERTVALIEKVREVVESSPSPQARDLLLAAAQRAREARDRGQRGDREGGCRLVKVAQALAIRAGELARQSRQRLVQLEEMLQRSDEVLHKTAEDLQKCTRPEAARVLEGARRQQKEAWTAFHNRRPETALMHTRMARDGADRARRFCGDSAAGDGVDARRVETELRRTDDLLVRLRDALPPGRDLPPRFLQARRIQDQAWNQYRREHLVRALFLTRQVRLHVGRALDEHQGRLDPEQVERMLESTEDLLASLEMEAGSMDERTRTLYLRATSQIREARVALREGRTAEALRSLRVASALALDVAERLEEPGDE